MTNNDFGVYVCGEFKDGNPVSALYATQNGTYYTVSLDHKRVDITRDEAIEYCRKNEPLYKPEDLLDLNDSETW